MAERIPPKPGAAAPPTNAPTSAPSAPVRPGAQPQIPVVRGRGQPGALPPAAGGATSARARVLGRSAGRSGTPPGEAAGDAPDVVSPRARIGDPTLDAETFAGLSVLLAAEHLDVLMARRRGSVAREALIAEAGDLLLTTEDPAFVRRVLAVLAEQERIHDVYPLEVLAYALERRPDLVDTHRFTPFVLNRAALTATVYRVEEPIRLQIPLSATMKALALEGGGAPGYHLYPGAPAEYVIELGAAGRFSFLLRAEVRRESVIDRITITVEDEAEEPERA